MRRLLASAAAIAAAVVYAGTVSSAQNAAPAVREQLVGTWELISYVSYDSTGHAREMGYTGRITYDRFGNVTAVGMPRDVPDRSSTDGEVERSEGFAYFATFAVDEKTHRVLHHVNGSPTHPAWVNTNLVRYYDLRADTLTLSIRDPDGRVTGKLTWRRFR